MLNIQSTDAIDPNTLVASSAGVSAGVALSPTNSLPIGGAAAGFGVGLLVGGIIAIYDGSVAKSMISNVILEKDFGPRMQLADVGFGPSKLFNVNVVPTDSFKTNFRRVGEGVVSIVFTATDTGTKEYDGKSRISFVSAVGFYRGAKYRNAYPETKGWEFVVSNLNRVYVSAPQIESWLYNEESYKAVKKSLVENDIRL